jgi:hypothetical protein
MATIESILDQRDRRMERILIPKKWQNEQLKSAKVLLKLVDDNLFEIRADSNLDLTKYFDIIEIDMKSLLFDWHSLRKEIRRR